MPKPIHDTREPDTREPLFDDLQKRPAMTTEPDPQDRSLEDETAAPTQSEAGEEDAEAGLDDPAVREALQDESRRVSERRRDKERGEDKGPAD